MNTKDIPKHGRYRVQGLQRGRGKQALKEKRSLYAPFFMGLTSLGSRCILYVGREPNMYGWEGERREERGMASKSAVS